jgi:DNA-binding transcriptional LysR family regulator
VNWKKKLDWEKLKSFHSVSNFKNITQAAESLNISQPALSRKIQDLEYQVGHKLFIRTHRELILTEQGEILLAAAEKMITDVETARTLIQDESKEPQGILRIATTSALANLWISKFVPEFLKQYPKMKLTIIGNDQELDLSIRQADVAIRPYLECYPDLEQIFLVTFHLGMYASSQYLKEFGVPKTPEDLDHHRLIVFGEHSVHPYGNINWLLKVGSSQQHPREPYMCINSSQGLLWAAEAGLGIASLSQEYANENPDLIRILPDIETPSIDFYYVYPPQFKTSGRVTAFGEFLTKKLKSKKHMS